MGNPYKARRPRQQAHEVLSPGEQFARRLALLGAQPDEIQVVMSWWDQFDAEWTPEVQQEWVESTDEELSNEIGRIRAEFQAATTTPDEVEQAVAALIADGEPQRQVDEGTVPQVLEWVGDDLVRATAVLSLEFAPDGKQRKGIEQGLAHLLPADTQE